MEKYAIIKLGGKQFMVSEGDIFTLERQSKLDIDVLLFSAGKDLLIGEPILDNVVVKAEILSQEKARKIRVARFRAKSRHRRVYGHEQPISKVKIVSMSLKGVEKAETAKSTTRVRKVKKGAAE